MTAKNMIGKTIESVQFWGYKDYDDVPFMKLIFTDGSEVVVTSTYKGFTGNSIDEYPSFVVLKDDIDSDEDIELKNEL